MASAAQWREKLQNGGCDEQLTYLYKSDGIMTARNRILRLLEQFTEHFGEREEVHIISAPGRTELGGNHTDHQNGRVLAAAVTMDKIAIVSPQPEGPIELTSATHPLPPIDWHDLAHYPEERGHSPSLIRGLIAGFEKYGYRVGGFAALTDSEVPTGSGLSSSASFEILLGSILNYLYNKGEISPLRLAQIGRYAENVYFGKPCGLMDQTACAVGGIVAIDFTDPEEPKIEPIRHCFEEWGMKLYIVNAGGSHADLTEEYAAIPAEMKQVASVFAKDLLGEVSPEEFRRQLPALRGRLPDRAILRAIHFFEENARVPRMAKALQRPNAEDYLREMIDSGYSSFCKLQNIYPARHEDERSLALALSLCESLLDGRGGWRVHGGGFAGTVQALVPTDLEENFLYTMRSAFGRESCYAVAIRPVGSAELQF